jgi:hypothetical protein
MSLSTIQLSFAVIKLGQVGLSAFVNELDVNLDRGLKEAAAGLNQFFSENCAGRS